VSLHTRIGVGLWSWEPWLALEPAARMLWMALYTTGEAKRCAPGLWHGGPQVLADAASMSYQDVQGALEEMVDKKMVEWDRRARVIRMTMLPDDAERPSNGNCIRGWWRRFQTVPDCAVRNRHIDLLKWLIGPMSKHHAEAWDGTFGTVSQVPVGRTRPTEQRMVTTQGSLFTDSAPSGILESYPHQKENRSPNGSSNPWVYGSSQSSGSDLSAPAPEPPIPDLSTASNPPLAIAPDPVVPAPPTRLAAAEVAGCPPGATESPPPPEAPAVDPLTPHALHEALVRSGGGRYLAGFDPRLEPAITQAIRTATSAGYGLAEVEHVGRWLAAGGDAWRGDLGASWISRNGNLVEAIERAARWKPGESILAALPRAAPMTAGPAPPSRPALFVPEPPIPAEQRAGADDLAFARKYLGIVKP
jgi:hypothetical protein